MTKDDDVTKFSKIFSDPKKTQIDRYAGIYGLQQGPDETDEQFRQRIIAHQADVHFETSAYGRSFRRVPDGGGDQ